jgi:hypothetical protein
MILTYLQQIISHSHQKMGPEGAFYEGRQRKNQTERQPRIVGDLVNVEYLDD